MSKRIFLALIWISCIVQMQAQVDSNTELFRILYTQDSLLFNVGFNQCELAVFEEIISEEFEFFHDQSGITSSKSAFLASIKDGLCKLDYQPRRSLVKESLTVFPMYSNGQIYGAIQSGEHHFLAKYPGKEEQLTSVAKFTHLWLLEDGSWRLARGLSYDHQEK